MQSNRLVFINMVAIWVRTGKPNPRSLLLSKQFGFGPAKIDGPSLLLTACRAKIDTRALTISHQKGEHGSEY